MTAHGVAVACGVTVLAMAAMEPAAAFDEQRTVAFDRTAAIVGSMTEPVTAATTTDIDFDQHDKVIARDRSGVSAAGFGRGRARGEKPRSAFTSYAGIGIDKLKLSMDFDSGDVVLKKDKGFTRPRLILGMGYAVTEDLSLGLEYRALASDEPLFSLDMGSETLNVDTKFTRHNLFLTARYRF